MGWAEKGDADILTAAINVRVPFPCGVLRLREHTLFREGFLLDDFMSVLGEIFPGG
jgi:hypothetical protein